MNKANYSLKSPKIRIALYLTIIVGVTLAVYYPSFSHLLRGETYTYFMDSVGNHSAVSLIRNYFNYEMVRVFDAGDSLVFRPLLFTVLGIETGLFGSEYIFWRITAFLMHITATLCLFRLLWKIKPNIIALFATLFFSTSFIALNTILYEQINSYALFMAGTLTTLYYIYCGTKSGKTKHLVLAAVSMLVTCFFLEFGIVLAVLFTAYFWLERKQVNFKWKRWSIIFLFIIVVYVASYTAETFLNPTSTTGKDADNLLTVESITSIPKNVYKLISYWTVETVFPANFAAETDMNFRANPINIIQVFPYVLLAINTLALIIIGALFSIRGVRTPFLLLLLAAPVVLVIANAFYRGATLDHTYFCSDANYNVYIWMGLFIPMVYAYVNFGKLNKKNIWLASLALIVLISLSAPLTSKLNQTIKTEEEPIRAYFHEIDSFLESHRQEHRPEDEPDFSFNSTINSIDLQESMKIILWKGLPEKPDYKPYLFTMPEVLYWNYWSNDNPKYSLIYHSEKEVLEVILNE